MKTVCDHNACSACMLCADVCPVQAIDVQAGFFSNNAVINSVVCIGCDRCHKLCPQNHPPEMKIPIAWYEGWSANETVRLNSSSGGLASEIARAFIIRGGIVCACYYHDGNFKFGFFDKLEELSVIAGSKYVKSDPTGIYKALTRKLDEGKRVLMIGLPCQIDAALGFVGMERRDRFYTIDLICHGTPSTEVLKAYLREKGIDLNDVLSIHFRRKTAFKLECDLNLLEKRYTDEYTSAFLKALIYTENCYHCRYAQSARVSDITLGDSWGSELPGEEKQKGISLILCQTKKGQELLDMAEVELRDADPEKSAKANRQLREPSPMPKGRNVFLTTIQDEKSFGVAMLRADPKQVAKNMIKRWIFRNHGGGICYGISITIK